MSPTSSSWLPQLMEQSFQLADDLAAATDKDQKRKVILDCLSSSSSTSWEMPPLSPDWTWFNVSSPLTSAHLSGRLVVVDFFTYCCINCLHILPDLHRVERKYANDQVLIVGLHSAKFQNEKVDAHIASALSRHAIGHPVANDADAVWWQQLGVQCWPTLLVLDPRGRPIQVYQGEGHGDALLEFLDVAVEVFQSELGPPHCQALPAPTRLGQTAVPRVLSHPGKVAQRGRRLFISDSGHHRILVTDLCGRIKQAIGRRGTPGHKDGALAEAELSLPQGLCVVDDHTLIVADTDNHALRKIDLTAGRVTTLCGPGGCFEEDETGHRLSSPWDVCLGPSPLGQDDDDTVYVAAAGSHQIWAYALRASTWWKGVKREAGACFCVCGSGREENRNNSYPSKAAFAQPSGVTYSRQLHCLFVADSESSSIRQVNLKDGSVRNLCGGSRDPTDLFSYGDADRAGVDARLQHPLGVAWDEQRQRLFVADSYNHKLKMVADAALKKPAIETVLEGRLDEPGGLCVSEDGARIYVADTNGHAVKVIQVDDKVDSPAVVEIEIHGDAASRAEAEVKPDMGDVVEGRVLPKADYATVLALKARKSGGKLHVALRLNLASQLELSAEAPNSWQLVVAPSSSWSVTQGLRGDLSTADDGRCCRWDIAYPRDADWTTLHAMLQLFVCDKKSGACLMRSALVTFEAKEEDGGDEEEQSVEGAINVD